MTSPDDTSAAQSKPTGLGQLRQFIAEQFQSPMGETLNLRVISAELGSAEVEGIPSERFYNPMQRVHGGFAASLIDTALGCAVMTKVAQDTGYGTIELTVNYVRRIDVATGPLTCKAIVLHAGRTMLTAEAKVTDRAGVLYAHGSGTFLVFPK